MEKILQLAWLVCCVWSGGLTAQVLPEQIPSLNPAEFQAYLREIPSSEFNPSATLTPAGAQADLQILRRALEEAHTPIYRYASQSQVDSCFAAALHAAESPMSYLELVGHISRLQHLIACGHSGWSHPPGFFPHRDSALALFPFDLRITGSPPRFWIHQNNSTTAKIEPGTELLTLNDQPLPELANWLRQHMYADGATGASAWGDLEAAFPNAYGNFVGSPETFKLEIREPGAEASRTIDVPSELRPQIKANRKARYPAAEPMGKPLRFEEYPEVKAAKLDIRWWRKEYMAKMGQDFETFVDSIFARMDGAGTENLVIDLRGNRGGWTAYGSYLLSYLIEEEVSYMTSVVTRNPGPYSFEPIVLFPPGYIDTFDLQLENGTYTWKNYPSLRTIPQPHNRFSGQIYVLTDHQSRACSAMFSALTRRHTSAVFIGEETGTAQCGSGGMVMGITLPHSQLRVFFSTAMYTAGVSDVQNPHGVQPDVPVPAIYPESDGIDPGLEVVWELIREK